MVGFITNAKDNINIPIDYCSMDLNDYDKRDPPDEYNFDFIASKWNNIYKYFVCIELEINISIVYICIVN